MPVQFKQKCERCKKNYVVVSLRARKKPVVCYECEKKEMQGEIKDAELKKLLDIPEEFYMKSDFLRRIRISCVKYGSLTQAQREAFIKVLEKVKRKESKQD